MKYLVQIWAKSPVGRENAAYLFDLRGYRFMKDYENVNTTIMEIENV